MVENPAGSERHGFDREGIPWSVTMPATYGYIARTVGADDDQADIYMGPEPESDLVFIIEQVDADTKVFDEHKIMLGYLTIERALADYDAAFSDGRGPDRRNVVAQTQIYAFKRWLRADGARFPVGAMTYASDSTRQSTPEGMMRAGAVVTRAGPVDYLRSELGLDGNGVVTVDRTLDSLRHRDTLASLRGAPITLGHPAKGVTPDNWRDSVVGAIAGDPQVSGNTIVADILIGDREALRRLDDGVEELSIGYDFRLGADGSTIGPLRVNHVALVPKGRAGSSVRVLDSLEGNDMSETLSQDAMRNAFSDALDNFFAKKGDGAADMGKWKDEMVSALGDAVKPLLDGMKAMKDAQEAAADQAAKDQQERDAAAAEAKAKDEAEKLVAATEQAMVDKFAVMTDALPLIPEDKRPDVATASVKDILVLAVGDAVPNAAGMSEEVLKGALAVLKTRGTSQGNVNGLPAGVQPFTGQDQILSAQDARRKSMDDFIKAQAEVYAKAGGR